MKKNCLLSTVVMLSACFCNTADAGIKNDAEKELLNYFDRKAELGEPSDNMQIVLPEIETYGVTFDDKWQMHEQKGKISSVTMKITADGKYNDFPRYKVGTDSLSRLQGLAYQYSGIQGLDAVSYREELYYVPKLKSVVSRNIQGKNLVLTETDPQTGLKEQKVGVSSFNLLSDIAPSGNDLVYNLSWSMDGINYKNMMLTAKVSSVKGKTSTVFDNPQDNDYQKLFSDIFAAKSSVSSFKGQNIGLEILGNVISFNTDSKIRSEQDKTNKTLKMSSDITVDNIKAEQAADLNLQKIKVKYLVNNIRLSDLQKLQALSQKIADVNEIAELAQNPDDKKLEDKEFQEKILSMDDVDLDKLNKDMALAVADILKVAELKAKIVLKFSNADMTSLLAAKMSDNYLIGNMDVTFVNLDNIAPDYKAQCEAERKTAVDKIPDSCMKISMLGMLRDYVDFSKRTKAQGQTIDKIKVVFDKTGVFLNGKKVSDAIQYDFNELIAERFSSVPSASEVNNADFGDDISSDADYEQFKKELEKMQKENEELLKKYDIK